PALVSGITVTAIALVGSTAIAGVIGAGGLQEQAQAIEKDENISALMQAEQKMSQVFQEINQIIVKPLDEIYAD
ncbi:YlbF family regulator, partial [Staphylococcus pasteuri]|uniref:YlbF family regulator n=1 Tax=Staphylococcus pasteuri TaxID=45972 RepID=UPI003CFCD0C4